MVKCECRVCTTTDWIFSKVKDQDVCDDWLHVGFDLSGYCLWGEHLIKRVWAKFRYMLHYNKAYLYLTHIGPYYAKKMLKRIMH